MINMLHHAPKVVNDRGFPQVEISYPYPWPGVRGWVFVIWGGGGEHHHGTCNSHPPSYSFCRTIL